MPTRAGAPTPVVWVQTIGVQWESTTSTSSLVVYADFVIFAPGDMGLAKGTVSLALGLLDLAGTIQANIAAAIRTYCTNTFGITIPVGNLYMPALILL